MSVISKYSGFKTCKYCNIQIPSYVDEESCGMKNITPKAPIAKSIQITHDEARDLLVKYNKQKSVIKAIECECGSQDGLHYNWCPKHE